MNSYHPNFLLLVRLEPTVESKVVEQCQFTPTTIGIPQHSGQKLINPKTMEIKKLIAFFRQ